MFAFKGYCNGEGEKARCASVPMENYTDVTIPSDRNGFIATGKEEGYPYQLVVLDFDLDDEHKNREELTIGEVSEIFPTDTFIVRTGSGGIHLYYWVDSREIIRNASYKYEAIGKVRAIDVRGHHGKAFIPNSRFSGHAWSYSILRDVEIKVIGSDEWKRIEDVIRPPPRQRRHYTFNGEFNAEAREIAEACIRTGWYRPHQHHFSLTAFASAFRLYGVPREIAEQAIDIVTGNDPEGRRVLNDFYTRRYRYKLHLERFKETAEYDEFIRFFKDRAPEISVNGYPISLREWDIMFGDLLDEDGNVKPFDRCGYDRKDNPSGYRRPLYILLSYYINKNINGWNPIIYCDGDQQFYEYENGIWTSLSPEMVKFVYARYAERLRLSSKELEEILKLLKTFYPLSAFPSTHFLAFEDTVIDTETLKREKVLKTVNFSPDLLLRSRIPHKIMPVINNILSEIEEIRADKESVEAGLDTNDTLSLLIMLRRFFEGNANYVKAFFYFISDLLDPSGSEQWILMLSSSEGGVGKGTLASILMDIIGRDLCISVSRQTFVNPHALEALVGKKLYILPETSDTTFEGEGLPIIKSLSGGDPIMVNPKYRKPYYYQPIGSLFVSTNDIPQVPPTETAIFRRLILIPLRKRNTYPLEEYDRIMAEIKGEIPQVIFISLLLMPFKRQFNNEFHEIEDVQQKYYSEKENIEYEFFNDFLLFGDFAVRDELYSVYTAYCQEKDAVAKTPVSLGKMLRAWGRSMGIQILSKRKKIDGRKHTIYTGIKLNPDAVKDLLDGDL